MMNNQWILPAEWQGHSAVLLSWPHAQTDWSYMIDEVTETYIQVVRQISKAARLVIVAPDISQVATALKGFVDRERVLLVEMPTNDTWARDFGMICTRNSSGEWTANDFKFNGWGLKFAACHDNLVNRNLFRANAIKSATRYANMLSFVLEGGSIDTDENGVLMTTSECLLSPNRNGAQNRAEIEQTLKDAFGSKKVIWIEHGALAGDDTDSHIDTLARFIPGHRIAYSSCDRPDDVHYAEFRSMEEELAQLTDINGKSYQLVPLPIPEAIYDEDGMRLPATYANFLIINGHVFLPVYGDEKYDKIAIDRLSAALPDYKIVPIDCRALIQQHGSLHCITMQIPDEILA